MVPIITIAVIASLLITGLRYSGALPAGTLTSYQGLALLNFPQLVIIDTQVGFTPVFAMLTEQFTPAFGRFDELFQPSGEDKNDASVLQRSRHTAAINKVMANG
jgi:hypothetical protein